MNQRSTVLATLPVMFIAGIMAGCTHAPYPLTTGAHSLIDAPTNGPYVIWSNHGGVEHYITGMFLQAGYSVVERSRLQKLFDEQNLRISLADTSEKLTAEILKTSKLLGASQVVFAEVNGITTNTSQWEPPPRVSIAVRSVSVESGAVIWSGTAIYPERMSNPDQAAVALAYWAVVRATCRVDQGYSWEEPSSATKGGCIQRTNAQNLDIVYFNAQNIDLSNGLPRGVKVAVFDPQLVLEQSDSGRRAIAQLKAYARDRQKELQTMETKLKTMERSIKTVPAEAMEKRGLQGQFVNELEIYKGRAKTYNDEINARQKELVDAQMQRIRRAVRIVAERRGFDLVVDNFENAPQAKIKFSPTIIEVLNQKHENVTNSVIEEVNRLD